jgi:nucleotide-binding universal stress UspA family protein
MTMTTRTRPERLLVPLAGADHDRPLLAYARHLADLGLGRRFEFVHVADSGTPPATVAKARADIEAAVAAGFGTPDGAEVSQTVLSGIRTDTLIAEAMRTNADAILLGHRRSRSGRRSLARRLAMIAPCSVWLVPEGAPRAVRRVLAPVDLSDHSADALGVAADLTRAAGGADLTVLHVTFDPTVVRYDEHVAEMRADERDQFRAFLAGVDTAGLKVTARSEEGPDPARTILRVAGETGADLLVMNTRGRSRAAAVLLGSVTARVLVRSPVAVLAVKHFGAVMGLFEVLREGVWKRGNPKTN